MAEQILNDHVRSAIRQEIETLGGLEAVTTLLNRALSLPIVPQSENGPSEKLDPQGEKSTLVPAILSLLRTGLTTNNLEDAMLAAVQAMRIFPISKDQEKQVRAIRRKLKAKANSVESMTVGETSPVLTLGKGTHLALQDILSHRHHLLDHLNSHLSLEPSSKIGNYIAAARFAKPEPESLPQPLPLVLLTGSNQSTLLDLVPTKDQQRPDVLPTKPKSSSTVNFSELLPGPEAGETPAEWGIKLIKTKLTQLTEIGGRLPGGPYEVGLFFDNPRATGLLTEIIELVAVLCRNPQGLNLVYADYIDEQLNEFQILNALCLARTLVDQTSKALQLSLDLPSGEMSEIPLGVAKIRVPVATLTGSQTEDEIILEPIAGTCDWVSVSHPDPAFNLVHRNIQDEFHRQSSRHRRKIIVDGKPLEVKTRLSRNLGSYLFELRRHYGESVFHHLNFHITDFKFPGGDGGWWEATDIDQPFQKKHASQLAEYLFFTLAQACQTNKRFSLEQNHPGISTDPDPSVTISEIFEFASHYGLLEPARLSGTLEYHMPEKKIDFAIEVPRLSEDFANWALSILRPKYNPQKRAALDVLRLLDQATRSIDLASVKRHASKTELPENLRPICGSILGKHWLSLDDLTNLLHSPESRWSESDRVSPEAAVYFQEEGLFLLLLSGLSKSEKASRLAVYTRTGRFTLKDADRSVSGKLSSTRYKFGVNQRPENLLEGFKDFWASLPLLGVTPIEVESSRLKDYIIGPDGKRVDQIKGKPLITWCDPVTGSWHIDSKLLEDALTDLASDKEDFFGIRKQAAALKHVNPQQTIELFCPLPGHNNHDTPAAALHPRDDKRGFPPHEFCYSCQTIIWPPGVEFSGEVVPTASGEQIINYRPLTPTRRKAVERVHRISEICASHDQTAHSYLVGRGLDPSEDFGFVGYVPPVLAEALADIARTSDTAEIWKYFRASKLLNRRLDEISDFLKVGLDNPDLSAEDLNHRTSYLSGLATVEQAMAFLDPDQKEELYSLLTLNDIADLQSRGVVHRTKDQGWVRWGGRAHLDMYWFHLGKDGTPRLVRSNFNSRTVTQDGHDLSPGRKYFKMSHRASRTSITNDQGELLRPAPGGFWVRNPEAFLQDVADNRSLAIFEGPLNAASLGRFVPDFRDRCLALCGTGHRTLAAIINQLGIRDLYFGLDSDTAGFEAGQRMLKSLSHYGVDVNIHDLWDLLPPELAVYKPSGNSTKIDLNDLLAKTYEGRRYAYNPSSGSA